MRGLLSGLELGKKIVSSGSYVKFDGDEENWCVIVEGGMKVLRESKEQFIIPDFAPQRENAGKP